MHLFPWTRASMLGAAAFKGSHVSWHLGAEGGELDMKSLCKLPYLERNRIGFAVGRLIQTDSVSLP